MDRDSFNDQTSFNDPDTRAGSSERNAYAHTPASRTFNSPEPRTSLPQRDDSGRMSAVQDRLGGLQDRLGNLGERFGIQDRADELQERVTEMFNIRDLDDLTQRVRANPIGAVAVAAGLGYLLQRTHLIEGVASAVAGGISMATPDRELTRAEERLLAWLNDAHAMELAIIPVLENHANDARRRPHVRDQDLKHLEQTRRHAKLVKECIGHLGRRPSKAKDAMGAISGAMNSMSTEPFDDEVVRNFLADYATENLEIASYRALIVAAEEAGHRKIARICEDILEDEIEMADWIRDNLPDAVRDTFDALNLTRTR